MVGFLSTPFTERSLLRAFTYFGTDSWHGVKLIIEIKITIFHLVTMHYKHLIKIALISNATLHLTMFSWE